MKAKIVAGVVLVVWASLAGASSGGLDRYGCHYSAGAGYHCHGVKLEKIVHTYRGETQQQRTKRLMVQCRGLENSGVCFGYVQR